MDKLGINKSRLRNGLAFLFNNIITILASLMMLQLSASAFMLMRGYDEVIYWIIDSLNH